MDHDPVGQRELRDEQRHGARAEDQQRVARPERRRLDGAQGAAGRLDHRPRRRADAVRQGAQRRDRHRQLLREGAGPPAADADLEAVFADVLPPGAAAVAVAAAEHGVTGDPLARPGRIDPVPDRGHGAAPFVAEPHRVRRVALVQVGHVAGEELDVGPAYAGPLDVHHHLAGCGHRWLDLGHGELARAGEYERSHAPPSRPGGPAGSGPHAGRCDPNVIVQTR